MRTLVPSSVACLSQKDSFEKLVKAQTEHRDFGRRLWVLQDVFFPIVKYSKLGVIIDTRKIHSDAVYTPTNSPWFNFNTPNLCYVHTTSSSSSNLMSSDSGFIFTELAIFGVFTVHWCKLIINQLLLVGNYSRNDDFPWAANQIKIIKNYSSYKCKLTIMYYIPTFFIIK